MQRTRESLDRIALLFALFVVLGPLVVSRIGVPGVLHPMAGVNTFFEQYRRHEPAFLVLMAVFAMATALLARRVDAQVGESAAVPEPSREWSAGRLAALALVVFCVTAVGTTVVMHALPLAMDEYVAAFQARIFAAGRLTAPLPDEWKPFGRALTPVFVSYDADRFFWMGDYLPVYSAMRAVLVNAGADRLLNPALAGVSIALVYGCARRLWPGDRARAWLAVAFLASSSQFLFMSMTGFAMSAHLALNLLWLYAFFREDRAGWLAAPLIGVAALGLHNPFPHALFVAPFLVRLVLERRWRWVGYFAAIYAVGIAGWYGWNQWTPSSVSAAVRVREVFAMPNLLMLELQGLSFTTVLTWQTPVLALALVWLGYEWRSLSRTEWCLIAGTALSFLFFLIFPRTQGHGWGYRYTYPVLGNLALLGTTGIASLGARLGTRPVGRLVMASLALTACVQLPLRAWQIERYVRPFALAHDYIAHLDADVVIVDPTTSWYGIDLVRNDPWLAARPKVMSAFYLRAPEKQLLLERYRDRVHMLEPAELARFGIPTFRSRFREVPWPPRPAAPVVE